MRILLASSEVHPYSKTGGLADMVGSLGKALAQHGHRVGLVTPLYSGVRERFPALKLVDISLDFPLGVRRIRGEVWSLETPSGLTVYFIDEPDFFQRVELYQKDGMDYSDNPDRFMFFSKAIAHLAVHLPWKPQILHLHDWQAGFAALFLHHQRSLAGTQAGPRTCMTIHNLAYQGVFPASQYLLANLPWEYFSPSGVEFYGQVNFLKAGISFADVITTVSPRYAREITTQEFGCGLEGLLRHRQEFLVGILNGVDYSEWDPSRNGYVKFPYSLHDLQGKRSNKLDLQRECGLTVDDRVPLFGSICRMVQQKGVDIMLEALEHLLSQTQFQYVLLGSGMPHYQHAYQELARKHPARLKVKLGYDEGLSHRIEAGADFFLMPSRFEPCGLNQMYSLRYGTIPIVRAVGGLDDTVVDPRDDPNRADGIKFHEYSARALAKGMVKALRIYEDPELMSRFRRNGMQVDFSWDRTAAKYIGTYKRAGRLEGLS